jgi:predicted RNA binding protein YcfA (HicA-like mRNA interferase family)
MSKLPRVSGQQVVDALQRVGFQIRRQHGNHIITRRDDPFSQTVCQRIENSIEELCGLFSARSISASTTSRAYFDNDYGANLIA